LVLREQADAQLHQTVVVGLVARRAGELGDAGALRELDPDFGDEHAFEVEADHLHEWRRSGLMVGGGQRTRGP